MKKYVVWSGLLAVLLSVQAAPPVISNLTLTQDDHSYTARIRFSLSQDAILVLNAFRTNGIAVAEASSFVLSHLFHCRYEAGVHDVKWDLSADWGRRFKLKNVSLDLTAFDINEPPDWAVFDLTGQDAPRYYVTSDSVPGGIGAEVYKKTKLLMRRIPAKGDEWRMGSCLEWGGRNYRSREVPHYVTLSEDYYMAVYEFTRAQYRTLMGEDAEYWGNLPNADLRPATALAHNNLMMVTMPALSRKTGGAFSLPTEAQWEYACRGGCTEDLYNYTWVNDRGGADPAAMVVAWFLKNVPEPAPQPVGGKLPNAWGLYDTLGNVWELCSDYYSTGDAYSDGSAVIDPVGIGTMANRRGGSYADTCDNCRSAFRNSSSVTEQNPKWGFRPMCTIGF